MYANPSVTAGGGALSAHQRPSQEMQQLQQLFGNKAQAANPLMSTPFSSATLPNIFAQSQPNPVPTMQQQNIVQYSQPLATGSSIVGGAAMASTTPTLSSEQGSNALQFSRLQELPHTSMVRGGTYPQMTKGSAVNSLKTMAQSNFPILSNVPRDGTLASLDNSNSGQASLIQQGTGSQPTRGFTEMHEFFTDNSSVISGTNPEAFFSSAVLMNEQRSPQKLSGNIENNNQPGNALLLFIDQPDNEYLLVEQDVRLLLSNYAAVQSVRVLADRPAAEVIMKTPLAVIEARKDLENVILPEVGILRCIPLFPGQIAENHAPTYLPNRAGSKSFQAGSTGNNSMTGNKTDVFNLKEGCEDAHMNDRIVGELQNVPSAPSGSYDRYTSDKTGDRDHANMKRPPPGGKKVCWFELVDLFGHEPDFHVTDILLGDDNANISFIMGEANQKIDLNITGKPENSASTNDRLHILIVSEDVSAYHRAVELMEDLLRVTCYKFFEYADKYNYPILPTVGYRRHEYNEDFEGTPHYLGVSECFPSMQADRVGASIPPSSSIRSSNSPTTDRAFHPHGPLRNETGDIGSSSYHEYAKHRGGPHPPGQPLPHPSVTGGGGTMKSNRGSGPSLPHPPPYHGSGGRRSRSPMHQPMPLHMPTGNRRDGDRRGFGGGDSSSITSNTGMGGAVIPPAMGGTSRPLAGNASFGPRGASPRGGGRRGSGGIMPRFNMNSMRGSGFGVPRHS